MQCFFDQLIGDMRPIKVAGVDVIDSEPDDLAQDCDRAVAIFWWPKNMWTSELHGAVTHASQDQIIGKLERAAEQGGGGHRFQIRNYELRIRKNENGEHRRSNVQWSARSSAITENANLESGNQMKTLRDCFGRSVRLTDERLAHTLERPEMKEMGGEIERLLQQPQLVKRSRSDEAVRLFYQFYTHTLVGGKWLCVVVKYVEDDAFVVTAYLTDKPKPGEDLWPIK